MVRAGCRFPGGTERNARVIEDIRRASFDFTLSSHLFVSSLVWWPAPWVTGNLC